MKLSKEKQDIMDLKIIESKILRDSGLTLVRIAELLNKNHSSIINYLHHFNVKIKDNVEFAEKYYQEIASKPLPKSEIKIDNSILKPNKITAFNFSEMYDHNNEEYTSGNVLIGDRIHQIIKVKETNNKVTIL